VKKITKENYGDVGDKDNKQLTQGKHHEKAKTMATQKRKTL
jgi:hypothetical protein